MKLSKMRNYCKLVLILSVKIIQLAYAQEEEYYDENGNQKQLQICSDSIIQVQDVSITCDSPGTYYYGSNKYRDSLTCKPGDKARVYVGFYIADEDTLTNYGGTALVTIQVEADGSVPDRTVYQDASLCSLNKLSSNNGASCPSQGRYYIKTSFYWSENSYNSDFSFEPNVAVGFKSNINKNVYDLGGANTNLCSNGSQTIWNKNGVRTRYANAFSNFMRTFGILVFTIALMSLFIWHLMKKPKYFHREADSAKENLVIFEDEDMKKAQLVGNSVIDF